jgi:hypothetical protein
MKKSTIFIVFLCLLCANSINAQDDPCSKYEGRPMPDWIMGATPEPHNSSYYYKVFDSASPDREEARNLAIKKAFQQAMAFISNTVNSADVYEAIAEGRSLNVISETFSIPIYFTCEFSKKTPDGKQWVYWILCQIAVRGNVVPQFDTHFAECNSHAIWDKEREDCLKGIRDARKKANTSAIIASAFIPGAGQMVKRHYTEGALTLVGEVALLGTGVGTYFGAKQQTKIMNSYGIDYATYQSAQKAKPIYQGVSYACFGLAAVLYGVNLWRAYTLEPKQRNYAFYPTIIPVENTTNSNYALGLGATIKF